MTYARSVEKGDAARIFTVCHRGMTTAALVRETSLAEERVMEILATLEATNLLPIEGLALLLGVDRFMSEARAITNLIGNGVATVVVSKLEGEFDQTCYTAAMAGHALHPMPDGEIVADSATDRPRTEE